MSKHPDFRIRNSRVGSPESSGIEGADDRVIAWLTSVPAEQVSHDLAPEILAKVRMTHRAAFPRRFVYVLAAAATIALLLGGLWLMGSRPADPGRKAVAWLCQTQEPDGSWSSEKWGGDSHFEVALTGLSLLTLLEESARSTPNSGRPWRIGSLSAGEPRPEGAVHLTRIIDRAIAYLIQHQQPDGRFGDLFSGAPYNQGIATLALAKAYETRKSETLRQALDRAVSAIGARQYADGGWGYHHEARPASNLSITLWQVEALRLAALQGWPQVKPQVERGVRWMAGVAADDGSFGYQKSGDTPGGASQTLTAMGAMSLLDPVHAGLVSPVRREAIKAQMQRLATAPGPDMDYYRRYFLAAALRKMDETSATTGLESLRRDLVTRQITWGSDAGSWKADDRWGSSGGRIYATAMASLSLR